MGERLGVDALGEPTYANVTITPEMAAHYHDLYDHNRTIRSRKKEQYILAMESGDWRLNGEGITFSWERADCECAVPHGIPLNGDHRFLACMESGCSFRTLVTMGVDPEAFTSIDSTASRMFKDDLTILGVRNASNVSGLLRKIMYWRATAARHAAELGLAAEFGQGGLAGLGSYKPSRTEQHGAWPEYAKKVTETIGACHKWHDRFPGDRGALQFVYWLLTEQGNNPEVIDRFFNIITFGSEDRVANNVLLKLQAKLDGTDVSRELDLKMRGHRQEFHAYWLLANWSRWTGMGRIPTFTVRGPGGMPSNPYPQPRRVR